MSPKKGISRRTAMRGLAGLALAISSTGCIPASKPSASSHPLGTPLLIFRQGDNASSVAWSPNGQRIASASYGENAALQVWDTLTGKNTLIYFPGRNHPMFNVSWSADGKRLAVGEEIVTGLNQPSQPDRIYIWDATQGNTLFTPESLLLTHYGSVRPLAWSPDQKYIVSGSRDETVQIWETATGQRTLTYHGHQGNHSNVMAVAWSPDGARIVSGSSFDYSTDQAPENANVAQVWDAVTGQTILTYYGQVKGLSEPDADTGVETVAWSPDNKHIVSGGAGNTAQIWNATTGEQIVIYRGHTDLNPAAGSGSVHSVAWSPDGKRIVSGSDDNTAQIWDATTGKHIYTYVHHIAGDLYHSSLVLAVAWSPDGHYIVTGSFDGFVRVWKAPE